MTRLRHIVIGLALACGPAAAQDGGLTVYTSQHASLTQAWADAYTGATGVPVTIRKGTDTVMANQIVQEGEHTPADIFLTENSPAMTLVEEAGLFAPVRAETLEQVPEEFRPESGMWTGIAARTTVFAYNAELLDEAELPTSILELADPEWEGRWGAAPAGPDFQAIVSALLQLEGPEVTGEWLAGLKRNALAYRGNFEALRGTNVGEVEGSIIYHYYFFGDRAGTGESSDNVALHYFGGDDPGGFVSVSGGGVLAASDNPEAAQDFLAFVTGPEGQAILRDGDSFEYAIASGVEAHPDLPPLSELDYPQVDPSLLNASEVVALMTAAGVL